MSKDINTGQTSRNQSKKDDPEVRATPVDLGRASDLEIRIYGDLEFAVRFARLAYEHGEMFDHAGFVLSLEKFLEHARNISGSLKDLRKLRGVTD